MEKPPYEFKVITHFSVRDVEKAKPRIDYIARLSLDIESSIPNGRYSLILFEPFPPLCRGGENLNKLKFLHADDIECISVFRSPDEIKSAHIEIHMKTSDTTILRCKHVKGVPGWDDKQIDSNNSAVGRVT
jgi:hypothetical protein